jgi:peptidyl-prolyl cis-trans isomerase SurA
MYYNHKYFKISLLICLILSINSRLTIADNIKILGKTVAIVNKDVITDLELNKKIAIVTKQLQNTGTAIPPKEKFSKQILNNLITEKLELQIAQLNNLTATEQQVNATIDDIVQQNNLTLADFKHNLAQDGINFDDYKKELTTRLTISNLEKSLADSQVKINDQELSDEVKKLKNNNSNSYRISHILISVPNEPDSEQIKAAQSKANNIIQELKKGREFKQLAMIASDGQQALQGGDLGWFSNADLPTSFAEVVPTLKQGQLYGPIQDELGFHIIKLSDLKQQSNKYQETQYKVKHILIKNDAITDDRIAKQELLKIREEILKKKNFADLALIYSEDSSAANGGSLGWISLQAVVPEFAKVVAQLKKGTISQPFKSQFGWHIVELQDTKVKDNTKKYQEYQARQIIQARKFNDVLASWQNKIRSESHIEILI